MWKVRGCMNYSGDIWYQVYREGEDADMHMCFDDEFEAEDYAERLNSEE